MKKTYVTSMPNHIGAFLKASKCFAALGINITRVSYDKSIDSHMLFLDVEGTEEQIRKETARCLGCGATKVDQYMCVGCGVCVSRCAFDAIHLDKKYDAWGTAFEKLPRAVAGHVVKRTINIAKNAVKKK